ncbi:hypothetical protein GNZ10_13720 [Ralstonia sp. 3N]|uniref:hypothetical protein n=1 Tax=Ralstonia sp. 3N TaxID=2675750 RepID=UPI0015C5427D|nr:hypothetical protein [Ralstonia sp. 3N]NPT50755.1 hypothetical protein [Ralstonia sp. 3N]
MLTKSPARNEDLRHVDTGLSAAERTAARIEGLRQKAVAALGSRWILSREHSPQKGNYTHAGKRLA